MTEKTFYDFCFKEIEGGEIAFSNYKGCVLLIVNTASRCRFTNQYAALQNVYDRYKDKGFTVI